MLVPKLRFKREDGTEYPEWDLSEFGSFCKTIDTRTSDTEKYPLYSLTIEDGVTPKTDRYVRDYLITKEGDSYKIVPNNTFVYNPMNLRFGALKANHSGLTVCVSGYYDVFQMGQPDTLFFWENYLTTSKMLNYYDSISTGSLIEKKRVYYSEFLKIKKSLPCLEEQQRIADFLSTVDEVITQSEAEVQNLEQQKKAAMQKIFSQEVRFKREDESNYPEWKQLHFSDISTPFNQRNKERLDLEIYSINNQIGFVPQTEQFDDAGYLKNTNTSIYMIVPPNHFAYNPARINVGSIGYQNVGYTVQVSSLYEVFSTTDNCYDEFIWHWFHSSLFNKMVMKYAEGGVRVYFYYDKLCETPIALPCLEEQQKIADFLSAYDEAISYAKQELEHWKQLKKGLLQQMFV